MASFRVIIKKVATAIVTIILAYMSVLLYIKSGLLMKLASILIMIYIIARLFAKKIDFQIGILELIILAIFSIYAFTSSIWLGILLSIVTIYFIYAFQKEYINWIVEEWQGDK